MAVSITTARRTDLIPSAAQRILMDDAITLLPWDTVPFQNLTGSNSIDNIKPQWLNEDLDRMTVTVNATSALASTTVQIQDTSNLRVNDVLKFKNSAASTAPNTVMMKATVVPYGTNQNVTVVRPFAGSTDQQVVLGDVLEIIGQDLTEGQDPQDPRDTDFTSDFNFTQIFEEACQATRTSRKNSQYGTTDPYSHQVMKKFREENVKLERAYINGRRQQSGATRQMGGVLQYVGGAGASVAGGTYTATPAQLFDMTSTATANGVLAAMQNAYEAGATPNLLLVSPAMKRFIAGQFANTTVFTQRTEETLGRIINTLHTDFGDVQVEMDRHVPRLTGIGLQREYVTRKVFDPWQLIPLAKTGDTDKGMIVGEYSLQVKNPLAHFILASNAAI